MRDLQDRASLIENARDIQAAPTELRAIILDRIPLVRQKTKEARQGLDQWLSLAGGATDVTELGKAADRVATRAPAVFATIRDAVVLHQQLQKTILERVSLAEDEARAYTALRQGGVLYDGKCRLEWDAIRAALGEPLEAGRLLARLAEKHRIRIWVEVLDA
jgi:hypothetical protein